MTKHWYKRGGKLTILLCGLIIVFMRLYEEEEADERKKKTIFVKPLGLDKMTFSCSLRETKTVSKES